MKTKYLDNEIQLLYSIKRNNEISDYGQEKLNEFIAIKNQLTSTDVVKPFYCKTKRCDKTKTKQCDECALQELNDVVKCNCKTPRPQMKVSENGISGYCANCAEPWQ